MNTTTTNTTTTTTTTATNPIANPDDDDTPVDIGYFDGSLDDLGAAYRRAVLAEIAGINNYRHGDDDTD